MVHSATQSSLDKSRVWRKLHFTQWFRGGNTQQCFWDEGAGSFCCNVLWEGCVTFSINSAAVVVPNLPASWRSGFLSPGVAFLIFLTVRLPKLIFHSCIYVRNSQHCWSRWWLRVFKGSRGPACSVGLNLQRTDHKGQRDLNENFSPSLQCVSPCQILLLQSCILLRRYSWSSFQLYPQLVEFSSIQQLYKSVGMRHGQSLFSLRAFKGFYPEASGMFWPMLLSPGFISGGRSVDLFRIWE